MGTVFTGERILIFMKQAFVYILFFSLTSCSNLLFHPDNKNWFVLNGINPAREEFKIITRDGISLEAWWITSATKPSKGVVVHFHGNAQNMTAHYQYIYWMKDLGYHLLFFDYRGYGISEGQPSPEGLILDGTAVLREAKARAQELPVTAIGQSLGGAILLRSLAELSEEVSIENVILDSTFLSYQEAGQGILSNTAVTWPFQWLAFLLLSDRWAPISAKNRLPKSRYLVTHGEKDAVIRLELGQKLFSALPEPKTWMQISNGKHIDVFFADNFKHRAYVINWLEKKK